MKELGEYLKDVRINNGVSLEEAAEAGANEYQIEKSKKATATMNAILGDPDRLLKLAEDFVQHYENRVNEGATVKGKAMFVCSSREIGYEFYNNVIASPCPFE